MTINVLQSGEAANADWIAEEELSHNFDCGQGVDLRLPDCKLSPRLGDGREHMSYRTQHSYLLIAFSLTGRDEPLSMANIIRIAQLKQDRIEV